MPASTLQVRRAQFSTLFAGWKPFFNTLHFFCFQCIFLIATTQLTIADFSSCIPEGKKLLYICLFVQSKKAMVFLLPLKYYRISKNIVI